MIFHSQISKSQGQLLGETKNIKANTPFYKECFICSKKVGGLGNELWHWEDATEGGRSPSRVHHCTRIMNLCQPDQYYPPKRKMGASAVVCWYHPVLVPAIPSPRSHTWESTRGWPKCLVPWAHVGDIEEVPDSWPSPSRCCHLGSDPSSSRSLSLFLPVFLPL